MQVGRETSTIQPCVYANSIAVDSSSYRSQPSTTKHQAQALVRLQLIMMN
jgi:hypothetical protein